MEASGGEWRRASQSVESVRGLRPGVDIAVNPTRTTIICGTTSASRRTTRPGPPFTLHFATSTLPLYDWCNPPPIRSSISWTRSSSARSTHDSAPSLPNLQHPWKAIPASLGEFGGIEASKRSLDVGESLGDESGDRWCDFDDAFERKGVVENHSILRLVSCEWQGDRSVRLATVCEHAHCPDESLAASERVRVVVLELSRILDSALIESSSA